MIDATIGYLRAVNFVIIDDAENITMTALPDLDELPEASTAPEHCREEVADDLVDMFCLDDESPPAAQRSPRIGPAQDSECTAPTTPPCEGRHSVAHTPPRQGARLELARQHTWWLTSSG